MTRSRSAFVGLFISTATLAFGGVAQADFVIQTSGWQTSTTSLNIDVANDNKTSYTGNVGSSNTPLTNVINITTTTGTDTGAGNAIIRPHGPQDPTIFSSVT